MLEEKVEKTIEEKERFWRDRLHLRIIELEVKIQKAENDKVDRVRIAESKELLADLKAIVDAFTICIVELDLLKQKI